MNNETIDMPHHVGKLKAFLRKMWNLLPEDVITKEALDEYTGLMNIESEFTSEEYNNIIKKA